MNPCVPGIFGFCYNHRDFVVRFAVFVLKTGISNLRSLKIAGNTVILKPMTRAQEIRYHIIFWILFIAMDKIAAFMFRESRYELDWRLMQAVFFTTVQVLVFYLNYLFLAPHTIPQKKYKSLALGIVILILVFAGLRYLLEEVILFEITGNHNYFGNSRRFTFYVYDNSFFATRILILSFAFYLVKRMLKTNQQLAQLEIEKKQAELQSLKSQLSPHFLFNTLNSLYSDLYDTSPKAGADILKLSEMLRYVTYENEHDEVLLKDEIQFLQNYIDLFQRRFDHEANIEVYFPKEIGSEKIPSLMLIHFVENAFKHGILNEPKKPVVISITSEKDQLHMHTSNYFRTQVSYDEQGIGYKNIRKRLELIYHENFKLEISQENDHFQTELKIPFL
ncbi:MAG: histidine kinase [Christiangramia sp.]|nr:histidine kinase [Christiangramia sp.]